MQSFCMSRKRSGVSTVLYVAHLESAKHFLHLVGLCLSFHVTFSVFAYVVPGYVVQCIQLDVYCIILAEVVKIPISMNEDYFIDRWGHDMVVLLVSLEDPPAPPFYRQEQLSSREEKSLVSLISGRIETSTAIAWLSAIMLFFYLPQLVSSVSPYEPPSAKHVRIVIYLHFSRKSFLGWHWEQKKIAVEKNSSVVFL